LGKGRGSASAHDGAAAGEGAGATAGSSSTTTTTGTTVTTSLATVELSRFALGAASSSDLAPEQTPHAVFKATPVGAASSSSPGFAAAAADGGRAEAQQRLLAAAAAVALVAAATPHEQAVAAAAAAAAQASASSLGSSSSSSSSGSSSSGGWFSDSAVGEEDGYRVVLAAAHPLGCLPEDVLRDLETLRERCASLKLEPSKQRAWELDLVQEVRKPRAVQRHRSARAVACCPFTHPKARQLFLRAPLLL
jgi:hypothetical protein